MPSISHAVEWGLKCCAAPDSDDPDFQGWYGLYEATVAARNMMPGTRNGCFGYRFDCESFVNIALCLGGNWPQHGDPGFENIGYKGTGWGNYEYNAFAGSTAVEWLTAAGFAEITDRNTTLLPGDVMLAWYVNRVDQYPSHAEMIYQEGGSPNAGGWHMGAHQQYTNPAEDVSTRGQYWSYVNRYSLDPACDDIKWYRYQYEDDDSTPIPGPGTGGGGGNNGKSGQKHRAWLYLRNPRLYNLRR